MRNDDDSQGSRGLVIDIPVRVIESSQKPKVAENEVEAYERLQPTPVISNVEALFGSRGIPVMEPNIAEEVKKDPAVAYLFAEVERNEDRREGRALVTIAQIQEAEVLEEKLRHANVALESFNAQFSSRKVENQITNILFLEEALYLEPERIRGLNGRFLASHARMSAAYEENLGFLERVEEYLAKNMNAPKNLVPRGEIPQERFEKVKDLASKAVDVATAGGGLWMGIGIGLNPLGIGIAGGLAYGAVQAVKLAQRISNRAPKYIPELLEEDGKGYYKENSFFEWPVCSKEYQAQARGYANFRADLRVCVAEEAGNLIDSLEDKRVTRTCKPEKIYHDNVVSRSTDLLNDLKTIYQAATGYQEALLVQVKAKEELEKRTEIMNYMRNVKGSEK
ncbi:MAG: hypothetical protein WC595_03475 [Candidatus Nanoarchaeia archaeon]